MSALGECVGVADPLIQLLVVKVFGGKGQVAVQRSGESRVVADP